MLNFCVRYFIGIIVAFSLPVPNALLTPPCRQTLSLCRYQMLSSHLPVVKPFIISAVPLGFHSHIN